MLNRRTAPEFVINDGWDSLSESLKTFLTGKSSHANYCCDYPLANLLWIDTDYMDEVCQNSEFWDCLVNDDVISRQRFSIRTKSDIIDTPNDGMNNDGTMAMFICDDSAMISMMNEYLSDEEYQNNFVLTANYVNDIFDIKSWITNRGIKTTGTFNFNKTDNNLKLEVKEYYHLTEEI